MRKGLSLAALVVAVSGIASASIVACPTAPITFATFETYTAGNGCEIGDTIFTYSSSSGFSVAQTTVTISLSGSQSQNFLINFQDANGFTANTSLVYSVSVDPTQFPASLDPSFWAFTTSTGGLQSDGTGVANLVTTESATTSLSGGAAGGTLTVMQNGGNQNNNGPITGLKATVLSVTDTYTYSSGDILNQSNGFFQADTSGPEPSTMMLMGGALVGLAAFARKRRKSA